MRITVPPSNASAPAPGPVPGPDRASQPQPQTRIDEIGSPIWNAQEIAGELKGFLPFYETRPIRQNDGGMKSSGLFTLWHILRKVNPKLVVESGVWKGQSTWLIENA